MGTDHVLSGLVAKYRELTGRLKFHDAEACRVQRELEHVGAAIKILCPSYRVRLIKPKRIYRKSAEFESGARIRSALAILRQSSSPLTVREIVAQVFAGRGVHKPEPEAMIALCNAVCHSLRQYARRGLVANDGGAPRRWEIAR